MNSPKALAWLRHFGVGPRAVARHLGIAEQTASNWSAGRHRMPASHEQAFLALLRETVHRAKAQRAQATVSPLISPEAPPTSLLGLPALTGTPAVPYPPERHPVLSYFLRLSPVGRDSMRWNLARTAKLLSRDRCHDPMAIAWHQLTYSHMLALRAALLDDGYAPQTYERTGGRWRERSGRGGRLGGAGQRPSARGDVGQSGSLTLLRTLGGAQSAATAINSRRYIAGWADDRGQVRRTAHRTGGMLWRAPD